MKSVAPVRMSFFFLFFKKKEKVDGGLVVGV